jgi:hypothetical protein
MLPTPHDKHNAMSQIHSQDNREHIAHSLSQPLAAHQTYTQYDSPATEQSRDNITQIPTSQAKTTKHPIPPPPPTQLNNGKQSIEKDTDKERNTIIRLPKRLLAKWSSTYH